MEARMSDPTDPAHYTGFAEPTPAVPVPPAAPAAPGGYVPPAAPPPYAPPAAPILLAMGDIAVTQTHVITPSGTYPLEGTSWYVADHSVYEQVTPQWALITAIVGLFVVCILSLLLLLVKETKLSGFVQVTVQGPGWSHVA
jgi:hypothetical protein